ncbi:hypothetical protein GUJ93_ZPchr0002g24066 [Zizania palustris]|uniref:Uncharacterized protein n=1 Tax=Zizania palustris TaxID=103762 RepID=A0A8J5VBU4_ZIZPA|nr:hypothetical protein GUJ93_ZPchr0002g24066 [Zizania palustris]
MASPAAPTEFSQEAARQSLMEISQSLPETPSPPNPEVKSPSVRATNENHEDGAEKYRSKLISISDSSPDS